MSTPAWVRTWLPEGRALPDEIWLPRQRALQRILWAHVVGVFAFGVVRNYDTTHVALEAAAVAIPAVFAVWGGSRMIRTVATVLGLLTASSILTHLSGGMVEMHFHFFVMLGVISIYQDWTPFLLALGYVVVHHSAMGTMDPDSVYNHYAALNNPVKWGAIHGLFVLAACAAHLAGWRLIEQAHAQAEGLAVRLREGEIRRRQALEINDNVVQGLTVAKYALDADDVDAAREAVARTLDSARNIIGGLLHAEAAGKALGPGDLVREKPAESVLGPA